MQIIRCIYYRHGEICIQLDLKNMERNVYNDMHTTICIKQHDAWKRIKEGKMWCILQYVWNIRHTINGIYYNALNLINMYNIEYMAGNE